MAEAFEKLIYPSKSLNREEEKLRGERLMSLVREKVAEAEVGEQFGSWYFALILPHDIATQYSSSPAYKSGISVCLRHLRDEGLLKSEGSGIYTKIPLGAPSKSPDFVTEKSKKHRIEMVYLLTYKNLWQGISDETSIYENASDELKRLYPGHPSYLIAAIKEVKKRILSPGTPTKMMRKIRASREL